MFSGDWGQANKSRPRLRLVLNNHLYISLPAEDEDEATNVFVLSAIVVTTYIPERFIFGKGFVSMPVNFTFFFTRSPMAEAEEKCLLKTNNKRTNRGAIHKAKARPARFHFSLGVVFSALLELFAVPH